MGNQSSTRSPTALDRLAQWTLTDHPAYREPTAQRQAMLIVLDSIGCAYAAHATGAMDGVFELAHELGGAPDATIIGSAQKTSVLNAILANGALVRVLDLNDIMFSEKEGALAIAGHRSDNVPVALAMAEKVGCSGSDMLASVILNYELCQRLWLLTHGGAPWDGVSVSGIVAAAMAGRLMGLNATQQAHGLGLAAIRTAVPKIARKGEMSAGKSLANTMVAESGVQAALLAAKGLTGPREALDHPDGLHLLFDPKRGLEALWAAPNQPLDIMSAHMKSYPSIGTSQTMVTAALAIQPELKNQLDAIEKIEVAMADVPSIRLQQADLMRSHPETREAADHSFTFLPCVTFVDGELTDRQFENERWHDPAIRQLMDRVTLTVDADLRDRAPGSMPCRLRVTLAGGKEVVSECLYPPGHSFPDKGLDPEAVKAKFHSVTAAVLPEAARDRIIAAVFALSDAPSLGVFAATLAKNGVV
jgi:2-methylcitrate dehydratase